MKSLLTLHISVLRNVGQFCSVDITRDVTNITKRCEHEGDGFLTITMPKLAKALEKGLETGQWPAQDVEPIWGHVRGLPAFMRGFLSRVFDADTGAILETPDAQCIWAVRQACLLTQKVERDCTDERVRAAIDQFISTDRELLYLPRRIDEERLFRYKRKFDELFGPMLHKLDTKVANWELIPKHGPGAVADRLTQLGKRDFQYWTDRLEAVFPRWRYTANNPQGFQVQTVPISDELPVRVVTVPKTQTTPRIIAIEPSSVQYAQQGLKREIYEWVERGPLRKVLGFQDQTRNRDLARAASITGSHSTLDLSEASDRIHWFLVDQVLLRYPHLREYVRNTRSYRADVPFYGVQPLQKFASMGSALTFPIEAMVFTTLAVLGIEQTERRRIKLRELPGRISVYGDDIIVPIHTTDHVVDWLQHFGAKVNQHKSFRDGKFRESCGAEYYDGHDVSIVRVRSELPSSRGDAAEIAALVDLRNRAYVAGMWTFVHDLDEALDGLTSIPTVRATEGGDPGFIARISVTAGPAADGFPLRWNADLQRVEQLVPCLISHGVNYTVGGEAGLLEWFHSSLRRGDLVDRYTSKERATSFSIKRRWVRVSR